MNRFANDQRNGNALPQAVARRVQWHALGLLALALVLTLASNPTLASNRLALVIGNADYQESPLKNPVNDARAMSEVLRAADFEVISALDADLATMQQAVLKLGQKVTRDSTVLVFYAGHGVQSKGRNYLLPVDAVIDSENSLRYKALDLTDLLDELADAGGRVNIVILDACRNNPFANKTRGGGRGLAAVDAARGTLIAYATAPGSVAADGAGENGLYTESLLRAIREPNLKVEEVFKRVRIAVSESSNGMQVPWESSSLTGDFIFFSGPGAKSPAQASPAPQPDASPPAVAAVSESRLPTSRCNDLSGSWANRNEGPALCPPPILTFTQTGHNVYDVSGSACGATLRGSGIYKNGTLTVNWKMTPCTGSTAYAMDQTCDSGAGPMTINKTFLCADTDNTGHIQRTLHQ